MSLFDHRFDHTSDQPVMQCVSDAAAFFTALLSGIGSEQLWIGYLDHAQRLISLSLLPGPAHAMPLPVARIMRQAVSYQAAGILIAHTHRSGDCCPNRAELLTSRKLSITARGMAIRLVNHLIIARANYFSFRAAGLL
jgi:DNA repair protein RadC